MGYQSPTLEELEKLAVTLNTNYKGGNLKRRGFVKLINNICSDEGFLNDPDAHKVLIGAYLFEMEHIYNSYRLRSAENSALFRILKKGLKIDRQNDPSVVNRLIYLSAFHKYLKAHATDEITKDTHWHRIDPLKDQVLEDIKLLLNRQQTHINCLLTALPKPSQLQLNMKDTEARYSKMSPAGWFSGGAHIKEARFIDFINDYCERFLDEVTPDDQNSTPFMLRMAAMVYTMKMIEDTYMLRSGKNSSLYNLCCKATNINSTADLDFNEKGAWLSLLNIHLNSILENNTDFLEEKQKQGYDNIKIELQKILVNLCQQLAVNYKMQTAPNRVEAKMISATSGAAQYGMVSAMQSGLGIAVRSPAGVIIDATMGTAGFAVFGPGGALLGTTLSRLVRNHLVPLAVASVFSEVLEKIGRRVGQTVTGIVVVPFSYSAAGLKKLIDWYRHVEINPKELRANEEWITSLMELPDDIFAPDKKARIESTFGIKADTSQDYNGPIIEEVSDDEELEAHDKPKMLAYK